MTESIARTSPIFQHLKSFAAVVCALLATVALGCEEGERRVTGAYEVKALQQFRSEKNDFLRRADDSPIPVGERASFPGLRYFPPDSAFVVPADYTPFADPESVSMMMTSGDPVTMLRAGRFSFTIEGEDVALTAYKNPKDPERLFLPFRDATNDSLTYWAGRYLDVPQKNGGEYLLDFNYAYSPYCAYNHAYACPVVPLDNILAVAIRAGEQVSVEYNDKQNR